MPFERRPWPQKNTILGCLLHYMGLPQSQAAVRLNFGSQQLLLSTENVSFPMFAHMEQRQVSWTCAAVCPQQRELQFCQTYPPDTPTWGWLKREREGAWRVAVAT